MRNKSIFLIQALIILVIGCTEKRNKCILIGTVVNPQDDTIILYQPNQDPWFDSIIEIPIIDSSFRFECEIKVPVGYDLMYGKDGQPGGRYMTVFLERGEIMLTIYPETDWDKNTVIGGKINKKYQLFYREEFERYIKKIELLSEEIQVLIKNNDYYSQEMNILREEKENASPEELVIIKEKIDRLKKNNANLSEPARKINEELSQIFIDRRNWKRDYIKNNTNAISYYLFLSDLSYNDEFDLVNLYENYDRLKNAFPDHPYNSVVEGKLFSLQNIKVGQKYIDFSAPDIEGNIVQLSTMINNKIALIDLWASWCSPCILNSRAIIPIYEEYKNKGFTVVGVAGEFNNTKQLEACLDRENFPWLNLVELDRHNSIWEIYGVYGGGGGTFLVDSDGKIIAMNPSSEEVKNILNDLLSK